MKNLCSFGVGVVVRCRMAKRLVICFNRLDVDAIKNIDGRLPEYTVRKQGGPNEINQQSTF